MARHYIFVGCDAHSKTLLLKHALDRGEVRQRSYRNTRKSRAAMVGWLQEQARRAGGAAIWFVYEASGLGWTLHDELTEAGVRCSVLAPTKIERSVHHRRNKCDAKDAERLLDLVRGHVLAGTTLPTVWVPDAEARDAKELVRGRLAVGDLLTAVKNAVTSLLGRHGVERPAGLGKKNWTKRHREWLERLVSAEGPLGWGTRSALGSLLTQVAALEREVDSFDGQISALARAPRYAPSVVAMVAFKGVGELTALVVLTELGDLRRFSNRRQVAAYVGIVPAKNESGEADDRKGHITHQGPSRVRRVLAQAVHSWVRWDPEAKAVYGRLKARNPKKKKKIALVAMMRRLLIRLWHRGQEALEPVGAGADAEAPDPQS